MIYYYFFFTVPYSQEDFTANHSDGQNVKTQQNTHNLYCLVIWKILGVGHKYQLHDSD